MSKASDAYEAVARKVVADLGSRFGVLRVDAKRDLSGKHRGTAWEIDGIAWLEGGQGLLLIEAR